MSNQTPGSGLQFPRKGYYTGYNIHATAASRTVAPSFTKCPSPASAAGVISAGAITAALALASATRDLRRGDVLQFDPFDHGNFGASAGFTGGYSGAPTVANERNLGMDWNLAVPTLGFEGSIAVVSGPVDSSINDLDTLVTDKRRGGPVDIKTSGLVQAYVVSRSGTLSTTKGTTLLGVCDGQTSLEIAAPTSVAHMNTQIGPTAAAVATLSRPLAVAMETVSGVTAGTAILLWVKLLPPAF